jgi:hypothetical protein
MRTPNAATALRRMSPALALALALTASACGGSSDSSSTSSSSSAAAVTSSAAATASTTAAASAAAKPRAHLRILSPRAGARSGETLTVRVALSGAAAGSDPLRYVLDGRLTRRGSRLLTYHDLAPGHHHLQVSLVSNRGVHKSTVFTVPAPPPPPAPAPAAAPTPPPATMTMPPPATMTAPPSPPPVSGIPQGDGGDHDGDNNGSASDGDGNI